MTVTSRGADVSYDGTSTPLRAMAFNVFLGGTYCGGAQNLRQLIDFLRVEDPDVVFMVETYGSGAAIEAGLNRGRAEPRRYRGIQVTREPGQEPDRDNLWLFTRYPVTEVYPRVRRGTVTSFHFGGARIRLPSGRGVNLFSIWLDVAERAWFPTDATALDRAFGRPASSTPAQLADSDRVRRYARVRTILDDVVPALVPDPNEPVIVGGDLNTLSAYDWSSRFAAAPGHAGLVVDWPVTKAFAEAGFTDAYRSVYPDAASHPGRTWSPYWGFGYAPARIDYVWFRGPGVRAVGAHIHTERLGRHAASEIANDFPFYSDHGALVADLLVDGGGGAPFGRAAREFDPPELPDAPPTGVMVDPRELHVSASTEQLGFEASKVFDHDPHTFWHSAFDESGAPPQSLTVDLGRPRLVAGVRYVGQFVGRVYEEPGHVAGIDRYVVSVSRDGLQFVRAGSGRLARSRRPQWIAVSTPAGAPVRYLRLTGVAGFMNRIGVSVLEVYEYA